MALEVSDIIQRQNCRHTHLSQSHLAHFLFRGAILLLEQTYRCSNDLLKYTTYHVIPVTTHCLCHNKRYLVFQNQVILLLLEKEACTHTCTHVHTHCTRYMNHYVHARYVPHIVLLCTYWSQTHTAWKWKLPSSSHACTGHMHTFIWRSILQSFWISLNYLKCKICPQIIKWFL